MVREVGNVTEDTELTFEYTLKKISDIARMEDIDLSKMKEFPFQAQITYKSLDGNKCIRVITQKQSISNDRDELEQNADYNIIGTNAVIQSSKMARIGNTRGAQALAKGWNRKMRCQAVNKEQVEVRNNMNQHFGEMYQQLGQADQMERQLSADEESDAEMEDEEEQIQPKKAGGFLSGIFGGGAKNEPKKEKKSKKVKKSAPQVQSMSMMMNSEAQAPKRMQNSDALSSNMYQMSRMNANKMSKK